MSHRIVYDIHEMRPACALLMAAMGGTVPATLFPSESWQLDPTKLRGYEIADKQLADLVEFHKEATHD